MNRSGSGILIPFSRSVALSIIMHLLFATTSDSRLSISIAFCCVFAIACTSMDCCTSTYTYVDNCSSTSTTFSSLASFCVVCASAKCYSTTLLSFDSSMNIGSIDIVYSFACQCFMLMHKNSSTNVLVVFLS